MVELGHPDSCDSTCLSPFGSYLCEPAWFAAPIRYVTNLSGFSICGCPCSYSDLTGQANLAHAFHARVTSHVMHLLKKVPVAFWRANTCLVLLGQFLLRHLCYSISYLLVFMHLNLVHVLLIMVIIEQHIYINCH